MEFVFPMKHYHRIYVSKVFGDEYSPEQLLSLMADEIFYGGTGYAIKIENGKEVFEKEKDHDLPEERRFRFALCVEVLQKTAGSDNERR